MAVKLFKPFVVFDAGIGSYAIVDLIRRRYPQQDVLYVADRASFPYGGKSGEALRTCVQGVIDAALEVRPAAVIVASNAPTVMVFEQLRAPNGVALRGVFPPVAEALMRSRSKNVVVLGVNSLIQSEAFSQFVEREKVSAAINGTVAGVNASAMVELVESGLFLSDPDGTQRQVSTYIKNVRSQYGRADVYTLSSTHLPWLRSFFERAAPDVEFLDPAQAVVEALAPLATAGSSAPQTWVTESAAYPLTGFADMLQRLQLDLPFTLEAIPGRAP